MISSRRLASRHALRTILVALMVAPLAAVVAAPARAADTVSCTGSAAVFAVDTTGKLWQYGLSRPGTTTPVWSPKVQIGKGWSGFGRVLAGPGGRLYGIDGQGVQRYRWTGGAWEAARRITTSWTAYRTAAYRDKITVDERGDFYLVDGNGLLRWSRYDEESGQWAAYNVALDSQWDRYDLIVAGTAGTLYARQPDGKLFRYRYDTASERWLERERAVGSGWNTFSKGITSAGGDTLFAVKANGDLHHYRFREDNGTWPVAGPKIGSGWQAFPNVTATTDTCTLTVDHSPTRPPMPADAPVAAVQHQYSNDVPPILYAYTDNGVLVSGSAVPGEPVDWKTESGPSGFAGTPSIVVAQSRAARTFVQRTNSDLTTRPITDDAWTNLTGAMAATPAAISYWNAKWVTFGVGADGSFWQREEDEFWGVLKPWYRLDGSGLTGALTAAKRSDDTVFLVATAANGRVMSARYLGGITVPWRDMGAGQFVGTPAVVVLPELEALAFARTADGRVMFQKIARDSTFSGEWLPVGDDTLRGTGPVAAIRDDKSGRVVVLSRTGDAVIQSWETAADSTTWGPATPATPAGAVRSDPTGLQYLAPGLGSRKTAFVVRNEAGGVSQWTLGGPPPSATFVEQSLGSVR